MEIQKEREAFESWLIKKFKLKNHDYALHLIDGDYRCIPTQARWESWQAAKASVAEAKLILELDKGRFKEYEFKTLLRQSLSGSKITRSKLNWVHVMHMLGTGSTVAHRICSALGVNPEGTEFKAQEPSND